LVCWALLGAILLFLGSSLVATLAGAISWLLLLNFCSYVKLAITLIKYMPQAFMNYRSVDVHRRLFINVLNEFIIFLLLCAVPVPYRLSLSLSLSPFSLPPLLLSLPPPPLFPFFLSPLSESNLNLEIFSSGVRARWAGASGTSSWTSRAASSP
jgi:hypothetical protein